MWETKKEKMVFMLLMCFWMASLMSIYNIILHSGLDNLFLNYLKQIPLVFIIAFILDAFVAGPLAKWFVFKFLKHDAHIAIKIISIWVSMATIMVFLMSIFWVIMAYGFDMNSFLSNYFKIVELNWIAAIPINLIIVWPIARFIFEKIFPKPVVKDAELT